MVVSSTSKRRPLWVLAAGFTNGSRLLPMAGVMAPWGHDAWATGRRLGATGERLGATGGRSAPLVRLETTGGRSAPFVRLETTGGRPALSGEWRRRRPGGVASVGACRQEPFGLHSPGGAQLPQNPAPFPQKPGDSLQNPVASHARQPA